MCAYLGESSQSLSWLEWRLFRGGNKFQMAFLPPASGFQHGLSIRIIREIYGKNKLPRAHPRRL